jgi:hypothetical protein
VEKKRIGVEHCGYAEDPSKDKEAAGVFFRLCGIGHDRSSAGQLETLSFVCSVGMVVTDVSGGLFGVTPWGWSTCCESFRLQNQG